MELSVELALVNTLINSFNFFIKLKESKQNKENNNCKIFEKIIKYEEQKFSEFYYLKALALRKRAKLNEIYYPVEIEEIKNKNEIKESIKLDKFDFNIFQSSNRILIEDQAGMGKTTLEKFLFLSYLENKNPNYIPIFIPLRNLKADTNIEDFIAKEFRLIEEDRKNFFGLDFIIFLDGFDEVSSKIKTKVTENLKTFINYYNKNFYILSSRKELMLDNFDNFKKYKINPLNYKEGISLVKKYAVIENISSEDLGNLITQLKNNRNLLGTLLMNPLLASLTYRAYFFGKNIPTSKYELYSLVFDALYKEHDISSKNGFSRFEELELSNEELKKTLSLFSLIFIEDLEVEYKTEEFKENLTNSLEVLGYDCSINKLLKNLTIDVPLFSQNNNFIFWIHKSMLDYFIALGIYEHNKKNEIIEKIINLPNVRNYMNILEFLIEKDKYEMLYMILNKIILETNKFEGNLKQIRLLGTKFSYHGTEMHSSFKKAENNNFIKIKPLVDLVSKYLNINFKNRIFIFKGELAFTNIENLNEFWREKLFFLSNYDYNKLEKEYLNLKEWKEKKESKKKKWSFINKS